MFRGGRGLASSDRHNRGRKEEGGIELSYSKRRGEDTALQLEGVGSREGGDWRRSRRCEKGGKRRSLLSDWKKEPIQARCLGVKWRTCER